MDPLSITTIKHFLWNGSQETTQTKADLQVIEGWKGSTLTSYNTAVRKFACFKDLTNPTPYKLPISPADVYKFVTWAGRGKKDNGSEKINATTL
jgi:hypothetical protein